MLIDYKTLVEKPFPSIIPVDASSDKREKIDMCKTNHIFIIKKHTGNLACVSESTAKSLIDRNWGISIIN